MNSTKPCQVWRVQVRRHRPLPAPTSIWRVVAAVLIAAIGGFMLGQIRLFPSELAQPIAYSKRCAERTRVAYNK